MKSRHKGRVEDVSNYVKTIDDFDELIDPRTLARHFLGPKPSPYVLHAIAREGEKKKFSIVAHLFLHCFETNISSMVFIAKMTAKFNQEMYA